MTKKSEQQKHDEKIADIVQRVGVQFRTFGGGRTSEFNPIAAALKDKPPMFAAGVDVRDVVEFVVGAYDRLR